MNASAVAVNIEAVNDLFESMDLPNDVFSDDLAMTWLEKHEKSFCSYDTGCYVEPGESKTTCHSICDSFNGKHLYDIHACSDDIILFNAADSTSEGFKVWSTISSKSKSKILYNIAQTIEKKRQLFANIEAVSSGKHLSRVADKDVTDLIESFNYYACCVAQVEKDWIPTGPVCVVTEEYNNPCLTFSLRISSLLASGSSILLLTDIKSALSSFLLAEICTEAGLPDGVLNVLPIDQAKFNSIKDFAIFSKLIFTGSLERSITYSKLSAETHIPCDILIPKRPVAIIYEKTDLYSAANGVLRALFCHNTRSKSGGCKVMIQESVSEKFLKILNYCFSNILVDHNMSDTDMSCIVTDEQQKILTECFEEAKKVGGKVTMKPDVDDKNWQYTHIMPALISNVPSNLPIVLEDLGGPVIVVTPFRTVKESISMFNCDNKGAPVSIWVDQVPVAVEVAKKLKTGVIWVNSENIYDAKTVYNGVYSSGNSVEGGKEALFHHMSVTVPGKSAPEIEEHYEKWLSLPSKFEKSESIVFGINIKEYKLFIGGTFHRSENGIINSDENFYTPSATKNDVNNAVASAVTAQAKWESLTNLQKTKIFFAVIDNLSKAKKEYVAELHKLTKNPEDECEKEVDQVLDLLHNFATQNDKFCEPIQEIKETILVLQNRHPLGVIGLQCPDEKPLLSLLVLVFSAIVHGNTVVAISSELYPTISLKMCEIFSSAKIPSGVINIICGNTKVLIPALCNNAGVNAIWFTDVPPKFIYANSDVSQRVFCCNKIWTDFNKAKNLKCTVECTFTKTIFLPGGAIFAN